MNRTSPMVRVLTFTILILMIPYLNSSCSKSGAPKENKKLSVAIWMFPGSFDPRLPKKISDKTILANMFEGLLKEKENQNSFEYALAKSVHISKDNLTYIFELKDVYWSNGEPLTAHDIKESWAQILSPNFACSSPKILDAVKNAVKIRKGELPVASLGLSIPEPKTLRIELEKPCPNFLKLTSSLMLSPVHKSMRISCHSDHPCLNEKKIEETISSGPFAIQKYVRDKYLVLKKNDYYHDKRMVRLEALKFLLIASPETAYLMFKNKDIHWLGQPFTIIHGEALAELKKDYCFKSFNIYGTTWLLCNPDSPNLNNRKIRKALSLAIDRENIVTGLLQTQQLPTTKIIPNPLQSNHPSFYKNYDHDKAEAKKLFREGLEELGMRTQDFRFKFSYPNTPLRYSLIAQVICENWHSLLGIEVTPTVIDARTLHQNMENNKFDMAIGCRIPEIDDAVQFLEIFDMGQHLASLVTDQSKFHAVLEKIQNEQNYYEKSKLILYAGYLLEKEYTIIPLYNISFDFAVNKSLIGFDCYRSGTIDFKNAEIK